jgi:hypothetical protein
MVARMMLRPKLESNWCTLHNQSIILFFCGTAAAERREQEGGGRKVVIFWFDIENERHFVHVSRTKIGNVLQGYTIHNLSFRRFFHLKGSENKC